MWFLGMDIIYINNNLTNLKNLYIKNQTGFWQTHLLFIVIDGYHTEAKEEIFAKYMFSERVSERRQWK